MGSEIDFEPISNALCPFLPPLPKVKDEEGRAGMVARRSFNLPICDFVNKIARSKPMIATVIVGFAVWAVLFACMILAPKKSPS